MAFDAKAVGRLAHLSRIGLSDEAAHALAGELDRILAMVDELRAAETEGITPMAHPLALTQRLRADEVTETPDRDLYQKNAPQVESGVYLVPRVIDDE